MKDSYSLGNFIQQFLIREYLYAFRTCTYYSIIAISVLAQFVLIVSCASLALAQDTSTNNASNKVKPINNNLYSQNQVNQQDGSQQFGGSGSTGNGNGKWCWFW